MEIQKSLEKYNTKQTTANKRNVSQIQRQSSQCQYKNFWGGKKDAMLVFANTKAMAKIRRGGKVF